MKSRFVPVLRQRSLVGLAAALVTGCFLAAPGAMADEERPGFYLRADLGANLATGVTLHGKSNDRASRCDEFINPHYAEIPGCTDPDRGSAAGWRTAFDSAGGVFAGFAVGHRITDWFRMEVETFHRESEYDQTSPVASATGDTAGKLEGEIVRAEDRIGSVSSRSVFVNLLFDLPVDGPVTPFAGLGAGVSWTELDYGDLWGRPLGAQCGPGEDRHRGGTSERGGDPEESRRDNHQQTGRTGRPPFGVPGSRRCGLGDFRRGIGRAPGALCPFRPLRGRDRLRTPAQPRIAASARRQRAGDVPDPDRGDRLLRGPHVLPEPPLLIQPAPGVSRPGSGHRVSGHGKA